MLIENINIEYMRIEGVDITNILSHITIKISIKNPRSLKSFISTFFNNAAKRIQRKPKSAITQNYIL